MAKGHGIQSRQHALKVATKHKQQIKLCLMYLTYENKL